MATAKILCFNFMPRDSDEGGEIVPQVLVAFEAGEPQEAIKFLTALGAFVTAYAAGRVVSLEDQGTQTKVVQLAPPLAAEEPKPASKSRARASTPPPPPPAPAAELPPVEETVIPPLGTTPSVAPPAPAATTPAPRAAVQQVPKATQAPVQTGQPAALSVAAPSTPVSVPAGSIAAVPADEVPDDLKGVKSFRAALVLLMSPKYGCDTAEKLVEACHKYTAVPCIARYMVPSPDPEMQIGMRVQRFLEAVKAA